MPDARSRFCPHGAPAIVLGAWLALAGAGDAPGTAAARADPPSGQPEAAANSGAQYKPFLDALLDDSRPLSERESAADRLLATLPTWRHRQVLGEHIERGAEPGSAGAILVRAVARTGMVSSDLLLSLTRLAAGSPPNRLPEVLAAIGSVRTRDAARVLVGYAGEAFGPETTGAALDALVRLSGRDDLPRDVRAWEAWLAGCERMTETEWRLSLIASLARRADAAAFQRRADGRRLAEAFRRLLVATPMGERGRLLDSMLRDASADVRAAGFDLALRELASAGRVDPEVTAAALDLLGHPDAGVREQAAQLVDAIAPPGADARVLQALRAETVPRAAAALLQTATRWPSAGVALEAIRWLESDSAARAAAADACWSLYRGGWLRAEPEASRVRAALRTTPPRMQTAGGRMLLAAIGDESDRASVAQLLSPLARADLRLAAAEALMIYPEHLDELRAAAREDSRLLEIATRAVIMHDLSAEGLLSVNDFAAATPEAHRAAVRLAARVLASSELLDAVLRLRESSVIEGLLALFASEDRIMSESPDPAQKRAIAEGLLLYAQRLLAQGRPDAAVEALGALPDIDAFADADRLARVRVVAFVVLGRIDQARDAGADAEAWLDALEAALHRPDAEIVRSEIRRRFSDALTPVENERLARLEAQLAAAVGPPAPTDPPQPPARDPT